MTQGYLHSVYWTDLDIALSFSDFFILSGIKFLWWTWHDTDAPVRIRILGVPVGSSVWVITFTGKRTKRNKINDISNARLKSSNVFLICPMFNRKS